MTPDGGCSVAAPGLYEDLVFAAAPGVDPGDVHVVASVLALAAQEARDHGLGLVCFVGLSSVELSEFLARWFPGFDAGLLPAYGAGALEVKEDEASLRVLLERSSTARTGDENLLARIIARRCQRPNHLWQDLGLRERGELSELMRRHFRPLARRNAGDMKWKKFLYRAICLDGSHQLCTAPTCDECADFATCFGEESGLDLLARNRRRQVSVGPGERY